MRTGGLDLEFTFLKIWQDGGDHKARLLQWNDHAGRPDPQVVIATQEEEQVSFTWFGVQLFVPLAMLIGFIVSVSLDKNLAVSLAYGLLVGAIIGLAIDLRRKLM